MPSTIKQAQEDSSGKPAFVEMVAIDRLRPHPGNARRHPSAQIDALAESIKRFGFVSTLVVDRTNTILIGEGRWRAAKKLGLATVPVIRADHLSEKEARAFALVDNRLAELSHWDPDSLQIELAEVKGLDFAFEALGVKIGDWLETPTSRARKRTSVRGQAGATDLGSHGQWQMGDHRLSCTPIISPETLGNLLGDRRAAVAICDTDAVTPSSCHEDTVTEGVRTLLRSLADRTEMGHPVVIVSGLKHVRGIVEVGREVLGEIVDLMPVVTDPGKAGQRQKPRMAVVWCTGTLAAGQKRGKSTASVAPDPKSVQDLIEAVVESYSTPGTTIVEIGTAGSGLLIAEATGRAWRGLLCDPTRAAALVEMWQRETGQQAISAAPDHSTGSQTPGTPS